MNQQLLKEKVAAAVLEHVPENITLGVGSGSTVLCFIEALKQEKRQFRDIVAASETSSKALEAAGFRVRDLNACDPPDIYVDGADEINDDKIMIKGGGAALTWEKIIASAAKEFICIIDESKKVAQLGRFPVAVEVIPMARSYVAREIVKLGAEPRWRQGVVTDNGHWILDVHYLDLTAAEQMEARINTIAGVVECGIFAQRRADKVLMSQSDGEIVLW